MAALSYNTAFGQPVRVQNGLGEWGFGWMFKHDGLCHVIMPRHVAKPIDAPFAFPKVTVSTSAPVASDGASIDAPFWQGIDLATAIIDAGPLDKRCTALLSDLDPNTDTRQAKRAMLVRLTLTGEEQRLPLVIRSQDYLTFEGELAANRGSIAQGTSGAFAFVGDKPIGMAITSKGTDSATFMRAEEIKINVARLLAERGQAFRRKRDVAAPLIASNSVEIRTISTNVSAVLPQYEPENLLGEGLFVVNPDGPLEITLRLSGDDAQVVRRVQIVSPSKGYAVPRAVTVMIDASVSGGRFRPWTSGQMRPDGVFDTGPLAARHARWVRIRVFNAWDAGALAFDRIRVE